MRRATGPEPSSDATAGAGLAFASAYSGCGGLDLGFAKAGMRPVWANDADGVALDTYRALLGDHAVTGDVDEVEWPSLGSADVVVGGPPCQGFSVAGKMSPADSRSLHVWRFLDLVEHVRPRAFVMENVKALAVSDRWAMVRAALRSRAEAIGYATALHVLRATDYGVPQGRERMFLIGLRSSAPPAEIRPTVENPVTVREALSQLPRFGERGNDTACTARITPARRPVMRPTAHRGSLLFNGNGRPLQLDAPAPTLPAAMGGNCTPIIDQHELDTGARPWVERYHQHLLDGGAPLDEAPPYLRRITVEEAAALQSFPVGMTWHGAVSARFRQIGNAVPPLLAHNVARAVAERLVATSRDHIADVA